PSATCSRAKRRWTSASSRRHVQRSAAAGRRRLGVVHFSVGLKTRTGGAIEKRVTYACETWAKSGGTGPPPEPEGHGRLGGAGQVLDLQAQEGAAHQRAGVGLRAGAALGMLLREGMQPAPGLQRDVALLRLLGRPLLGRRRPGGRVVT